MLTPARECHVTASRETSQDKSCTRGAADSMMPGVAWSSQILSPEEGCKHLQGRSGWTWGMRASRLPAQRWSPQRVCSCCSVGRPLRRPRSAPTARSCPGWRRWTLCGWRPCLASVRSCSSGGRLFPPCILTGEHPCILKSYSCVQSLCQAAGESPWQQHTKAVCHTSSWWGLYQNRLELSI